MAMILAEPELYYLRAILKDVHDTSGIPRTLVGVRHVSIIIEEDFAGPYDENEVNTTDSFGYAEDMFVHP